ncbi:MAG: tetratricopeptide repeat protein [Bryobacteraceae bacterium]
MGVRTFLCFLALAGLLTADVKREEPVGLVLLPGGAKVVRAGAETPLAAKPGDVLFAGDALKTEAGAASFLYCPQKSSQSLAPAGEVLLEARQLKVKTGKLADQKTIASCFLPQVVRVALASQQHYGVSMTRGSVEEPPYQPTPPDKYPPEMAGEIKPIDEALAANANDTGALLARAVVLEKHKLPADALAQYRKVSTTLPEATWIKGKIFELSESITNAAAAAKAQAPTGGQTFALLVGVSKYQKLPQDQWLQFASADAITFEQHVKSPRGGGLPAENVVMLTDEKATTGALRNAFQTFLKGRAGKNDTVLVLLAGHGTVEVPGSKGAYILTFDSDPQDLAGSALPMEEVQKLVEEELSKVGRVALFVDVCRAGVIGSIKNTNINKSVEQLGEAEGSMLGLMASRPRELSMEGPQFGGGHGVFSYFLLKGLSGEADKNGDGRVDVNEIIAYVQKMVPEATADKQHPREFGNFDNALPLSDIKQPGITLARARFPLIYDSAGEPMYLAAAQAQPGAVSSEARSSIERLDQAIGQGRFDPNAADSAFSALKELERRLPPERFFLEKNKLRVALEDRGQQVILRYLTGDQVPQTKEDFSRGSTVYASARLLTPESLFLDARQSFCRGRSLLFDKKFTEAVDLLERAVRLDPQGAQSYNALGIAYLEQARYEQAIPAFRDATRRAPHWAYPLHNLALAYTEAGDYQAAIRSYEQAMRLTPQYSYLPYNLGLVYQRLNRRREAEASYRKAIGLAPDSGEPYNALGSLKAATGKAREAEQLYRTALEKNPHLLPARHNLALLLNESRDRRAEAIELWRANLRENPSYLPSRLSLAAALDDPQAAIAEYRAVLRERGDYVAAHLALASLLVKTGDTTGAFEQLTVARRLEPSSAIIAEQLGDLERSRGRAAEASSAYEQALKLASDSDTRKRVRKKMGAK